MTSGLNSRRLLDDAKKKLELDAYKTASLEEYNLGELAVVGDYESAEGHWGYIIMLGNRNGELVYAIAQAGYDDFPKAITEGNEILIKAAKEVSEPPKFLAGTELTLHIATGATMETVIVETHYDAASSQYYYELTGVDGEMSETDLVGMVDPVLPETELEDDVDSESDA
jgi:hypothetical protein